jgi:hypothetical protein
MWNPQELSLECVKLALTLNCDTAEDVVKTAAHLEEYISKDRHSQLCSTDGKE